MVARKGLRGISLAWPTRGGAGGIVSRKRKPDWLQLCANPFSQSQIAPFSIKGCVLERSTPFQLKCHSQISCLRGQRRSTHALFSECLLQVPALASAHLQAPIQALHESPTRRLALAWTPPVDKSAPPCQQGSPPGRPWPFEGLRSMVRGGQPGPQESLRRGKRRPHLDPDLVGGEAAPADPHCLRVAHIDLEEVAGRPVGVIQVLRLGDQPPGVRHGLRHFAAAAAAAAAPPRTPSAPLAFYRHLRRRCCCPPRGHQARAQRSQGERARRAGVHPHARSSSPRPSGFRLLCPGGKQLTCRNFAPETRETQRKPRKGTGSRQRRGNAVLELGGANRFRPDYRDHNAPGERAPAGLKQSGYGLGFRVGIGFRVGLGLEQWKEH